MKDWIPGGERYLIEMCHRWVDILSIEDAGTEFRWDSGLCQLTVTKLNVYLDAVEAYGKADTSTNRTVKNDARKDAVAAMRAFAASSVRNNPFMDTAERELLGLRTPDTTPTAQARPKAMPVAVIEPTGFQLQHRVRALNMESGARSKPAGVHGVRFVWQVGGDRPANGAAMLRGRFSRRPEIVIMHDEADQGKPVYCAACYENARGEAGPWSLVAQAYVG